MKHIPNVVTILRIALTPVFMFLIFSASFGGRLAALIIFVVAALSDWLDGVLARHYKVRSRLGQFLDPLADKIMVLGTFIILAIRMPEAIPWWAVILIIIRDIGVTAIRSYGESRNRPIPTLRSARTKTLSQLIFLSVVLLMWAMVSLSGPAGQVARDLLFGSFTFILLVVVVALTLITGAFYAVMFFRMPHQRQKS